MTARERDAQPRARPRRRGMPSQAHRRAVEHLVRVSAVAYTRWRQRHGATLEAVAAHLGLAAATLRHWLRTWRTDHLRPVPRGRQPARADRARLREILAVFHMLGPGVGLSTLQSFFPDATRGLLQELLDRYRAVYWGKRRPLVYALRWRDAGRVWAADLADVPGLVDGVFPAVCVVRDLASKQLLAALPVPDHGDVAVAALLAALFAEHGAPLVLKTDNGGAFTGAAVHDLLERHAVTSLRSPPVTPRFNGAIEAGIGALRVRTHYLAARDDRPGRWTCDDLEGARRLANETHRPWGKMEPTPDQMWRARTPISAEERQCFLRTIATHRATERADRGCLPGIDLLPREHQNIERAAITRALTDHEYLQIRRRRLTLPISRWKTAKIS